MKRKIIIILITICTLLPVCIKAESYEESLNKVNAYLDKNEYKTSYAKYLLTDVSNRYSEMISKEEFDVTRYDKNKQYRDISYSYLWNSRAFWSSTIENSKNIPIRDGYKALELNEINDSIGTRITQYIKKDTNVYGSGSYTDPWLFSPQYNVHIKVNDDTKGYITNKEYNTKITEESFVYTGGSGFHYVYIKSIGANKYIGSTCGGNVVNSVSANLQPITNNNGEIIGTNGYLLIDNITRDTECIINFGEKPRTIKLDQTYNDTNVEPTELYMTPSRGWFKDSYGNDQIQQINTNPSKIGYIYNGYYYLNGKTNPCDGIKIIENDKKLTHQISVLEDLEHNTTLYACYTPITYYVAYNCPNGTPKANNHKVEHIYNVPKKLESDRCTRTGYDLTSWNTQENGTGDSYNKDEEVQGIYDKHGETLNLYAQWTPKTNIKYVVNHYIQNVNDNEYTLKDTETNQNGTADTSKTFTPNTYEGFTSPSNQTVTIKPDGSTVVNFYYTRNSYNITFDANGHGTPAASSLKTKYGATYNLTTISADGYIFDGWYTAKTGGTQVTNSTVLEKTEDHTLYAHWTLESFDVTYDTNGGNTLSPNKKTVKYSEKYGDLPTPTRTGYKFDGWYTAATNGTQITKDTIVTKTEAHTIYAHWSALTQYTATFKANGTSTTETTRSCYVQPGSTSCTVTTPSITASTNYTAVGWNTTSTATSSEVSANKTATISGNTTYYAIQQRTIKIKFNANAATIDSTEKSCTMYNSATTCKITTPKITPDTGYTIVGYNTSSSSTTAASSAWGSQKEVTVSASDTSNTYYAIQKKEITITFDKNGATSLSKISDSCVVYNSTTKCKVKTPTITRDDWTIVGFGSKSTSTSSTCNQNANCEVESSGTLYAITKLAQSAKFKVCDSDDVCMESQTKTCNRYNTSATCSVTPPEYKVPKNNLGYREYFKYSGWSKTNNATTATYNFKSNINISGTSDVYYAVVTFYNEGIYYSSSTRPPDYGTNVRYDINKSATGTQGLDLGHLFEVSKWYYKSGTTSVCPNGIWFYGYSEEDAAEWNYTNKYACAHYIGNRSRGKNDTAA